MNWSTVLVAVITAGFAFLGVYVSNRKQTALVAYRLEKLEAKVDKHNNVIERTYKIEKRLSLVEELMERNENTIEELREYHKVV